MAQQIKPTDAELEILNILWAGGPATVKTVHEQLGESKNVGYTTVLKTMQIMHEKGLLSREANGRVHTYTAEVSQDHAQGQMVKRIIDTVFNGSAMQLVMQALGNHKPSKAELKQIKDYLDKNSKQ